MGIHAIELFLIDHTQACLVEEQDTCLLHLVEEPFVALEDQVREYSEQQLEEGKYSVTPILHFLVTCLTAQLDAHIKDD